MFTRVFRSFPGLADHESSSRDCRTHGQTQRLLTFFLGSLAGSSLSSAHLSYLTSLLEAELENLAQRSKLLGWASSRGLPPPHTPEPALGPGSEIRDGDHKSKCPSGSENRPFLSESQTYREGPGGHSYLKHSILREARAPRLGEET